MASKKPPHDRAAEPYVETPRQDPWGAFGYVVSGVAVYGLVGWGLDQWWNTNFMVAIGIVAGAGLGLWMTWKAFGATPPPADDDRNLNQ